MMKLVTWLSVLALGPGSVAIFCWFLWDVKRIFGGGRGGLMKRDDDDERVNAPRE
jgi:hypothetical protein